MAPRKRLGHKIKISLDGTLIGCVRRITPPEKSREEVDVTCHDDELMDYLDSDPPDQGILTIEVMHEPGETQSESFDTLFDDADPDNREGAFQVQYQQFGDGGGPENFPTDSFSGRILKATPSEGQSKTPVSRTLEIRLTTKITRTQAVALT